MSNAVNSPSHYNQSGIEAIDALKASMSDIEFQGYLKGNTLKYLWRYRYKGKPLEDLQKAEWYLKRLIKELDDGKVPVHELKRGPGFSASATMRDEIRLTQKERDEWVRIWENGGISKATREALR